MIALSEQTLHSPGTSHQQLPGTNPRALEAPVQAMLATVNMMHSRAVFMFRTDMGFYIGTVL